VGEGIRASGVPRSEIFVRRRFSFSQTTLCLTNLFPSAQITSKLWGTFHNRVEECLDQSLANLGTDYLDCKLIGDSASEADALTRYTSVSRSLACRAQSEWKSSYDANASGWKTRRSTPLEIAGYLETDGGSF
jgi:hypothetical protein